MRSKKYEDILDAMKKTGTSGMMTHFGPAVDEKVVFSDYKKRLAEGNFIKAPLLIGNNNDEGGLTTAIATLTAKLPKSGNKMHKRQSLPKELECVSGPTAAGRAKNGVPAWRYLFKAVFPNTDIGSRGAYHTAEIPFVFGTTASFSHKVSVLHVLRA
jgi:cholinesterase